MSSLWSNAAAGTSPFATQTAAPTPGGGAAARFQSILKSAGAPSKAQSGIQPGLSPAGSKSNAAASANAASGSSSSASESDATISANDFLTLLVTEMQNQDPTADVDPNEYIDQLVQINSLEQLISINQNLATVLGAATSPAGTGGATPGSEVATAKTGSAQAIAVKSRANSAHPGASPASTIGAARNASRPTSVHGNLGTPGTAPSANTVGRALDGRARGVGHAIRDIPTRALP